MSFPIAGPRLRLHLYAPPGTVCDCPRESCGAVDVANAQCWAHRWHPDRTLWGQMHHADTRACKERTE